MPSQKVQIVINATSNMLGHFLRVFIGIFMAPFLLGRLGADVYGIIPLVNSCVAFLVLASGGIQSSVGRYFTFNLARKEFENANKYVNTAFFLMAGVLGIATIPFLLLVYFFPDALNVPSGYEMEARLVMLMLGLTLLIEMLSNPFSIGVYSKQRFELRTIIVIIKQLLHVVIVVGTFVLVDANIVFVAASTLATTILSSLAMIIVSKGLVPTLAFSPRLFDRSKMAEIGSYSFWVILSQVTALLYLNTDYIIINKLLDSQTVTDYSLAARWNEMIRHVLMAAVAVITPFSTQLDAKEQYEEIRNLFIRGLRFMIILVIPPSLLLCIFARELLVVWVGFEYVKVVSIFWASVLPLIWILTELPTRYILFGMGKVKWLSIAGLISAIINICFSIILVVVFKLGAFGVALGTSISLSLFNLIFIPLYVRRELQVGFKIIFGEFIRPVVAAAPMIWLAMFFRGRFEINQWLPLIGINALCVALFGMTAYFIALQATDRRDFWMIVSKIFPFYKRNDTISL